jgi:DNA polymerase-1
MKSWKDFKERWVIDYEFISNSGNPQIPICYVAQNIDSKEVIHRWINGTETSPEYPVNDSSLIIAYYASAEMGCHIPLKFNFPIYLLDLFAEFRCLTNGTKVPSGNSLIGACAYYGISGSDATYKDAMRDRILQGPLYSEKEKQDILLYCQKDVEMTTNLFHCMKKNIDLPYALLRGRYMVSVAQMEYNGIPIDTENLTKLKDNWEILKDKLIAEVDKNYNVYAGSIFKMNKFKEYLLWNNIPWEYTKEGLPTTEDAYMREQAKTYPQLKQLQELRYALGQLKLNDLEVGTDGRNRSMLSPFRSKTSRNQPSSSKFIFGNAIWLRNLITPTKGMAIAYCDYCQQEIGIAAALSDDKNLKEAYESGDPYLVFAKVAGAIPEDGTKETYPEQRELYKKLMLALNYGMSVETFALRTKIPLAEAKAMVRSHKQKFHKYWEWNSNFVDMGLLGGIVKTNFNWYYRTEYAKPRTLMNWPMQSHGADILRLAISMCFDDGIKVIAPIHDAILIEGLASEIDSIVKNAIKCMEDASEYVLNYKIRAEAKIIRYPDHYTDPRGDAMWKTVFDIINDIQPEERTRFLLSKIASDMTLDAWEPIHTPSLEKVSQKRRGQLLMKPENLSEKILAQKLEKQSGMSHAEIMSLIREARETDYDLEHEIDWDNESYDSIKDKIQSDTNPLRKKMLKELNGEDL